MQSRLTTHIIAEGINKDRYTLDCGVIGMFEGGNGQLQECCGIIQHTIKLDFQNFDVYLFYVQLF
jgi:hypothetical protein